MKIHDAIFIRDDELHKDFIVIYLHGRTPTFGQIQTVLIWGKIKIMPTILLDIYLLEYHMILFGKKFWIIKSGIWVPSCSI